MKNKNLLKILIFSLFFILADLVKAANFSLEIIQPRTGLDTKNRFYKAYPGLVYNVRASVIGGVYPFKYELTTAPSGMTINQDTGEINWENPIQSAAPYSVTLKVTDKESAVQNVSWTITVTTNGYLFVDAINGKSATEGGNGSLNNPFKSIEDWYKTKYDTTYKDSFIYWKNGSYLVPSLEDGKRLAMVGNYKPNVWLAYPGEKPSFNMSSAYVIFYGGEKNVYVDGIKFDNIANPSRKGLDIESSSSDVVVRKNDFSGTTELAGTNMAHVFITRAGAGQYWSFQENYFHDSVRTMGIEGYDAQKVLIEDNDLQNFTNGSGTSHGIGPKQSCTLWFIRHNTLNNMEGEAIWLDGASLYGLPFERNEVSYNLVSGVPQGSRALQIGYDANVGSPAGVHYIFRNTFLGAINVHNTSYMSGPVNVYGNVIQNASAGIAYLYPNTPPVGVMNVYDNLNGTSGLVDLNGSLMDRTKVGTYGWEINQQNANTETQPPAAPSGLSVQ